MSNKKSNRVWIVSGPSGSGKTTLCNKLLKDSFWKKRLMKSVSCTTRPLRPGEKEGRDYFHISQKKFLRLLRQGAFLESEKIFDFYYGTPKKILEEARKRGKDPLLCIDVKGAQAVKRALRKNIVSIFITAPGTRTLSRRLKRRCTEGKKAIEKRLKRVGMELSFARGYDYIVVNDDIRKALKKIKAILTTES